MFIGKERDKRRGFRAPAFVWLPAGVFGTSAVLFWTAPAAWKPMTPASAATLALACRRLARSGYPGPALVAWLLLGGAAVAGFTARRSPAPGVERSGGPPPKPLPTALLTATGRQRSMAA